MVLRNSSKRKEECSGRKGRDREGMSGGWGINGENFERIGWGEEERRKEGAVNV